MQKIYSWTADRSGAGLRINGKTEQGNPIKLTKVAHVKVAADVVVAERDDGERFELVVGV